MGFPFFVPARARRRAGIVEIPTCQPLDYHRFLPAIPTFGTTAGPLQYLLKDTPDEDHCLCLELDGTARKHAPLALDALRPPLGDHGLQATRARCSCHLLG